MSKYRIKIFYRTGNSFGSHEEEEYIEYVWENKEMALESVKRIEEYTEWKTNLEYAIRPKNITRPVWIDDLNEVNPCLKLLDDNGKEFQYYTFWIGYFESLIMASLE